MQTRPRGMTPKKWSGLPEDRRAVYKVCPDCGLYFGIRFITDHVKDMHGYDPRTPANIAKSEAVKARKKLLAEKKLILCQEEKAKTLAATTTNAMFDASGKYKVKAGECSGCYGDLSGTNKDQCADCQGWYHRDGLEYCGIYDYETEKHYCFGCKTVPEDPPDPTNMCITCYEAIEPILGRECWECKKLFCFDPKVITTSMNYEICRNMPRSDDVCGSYYADEHDFICHPCCVKKMKREAKTLKRKAELLDNQTERRRLLAKRRRL